METDLTERYPGLSRRRFLQAGGTLAALSSGHIRLPAAAGADVRDFHVCLNPAILEQDPDLLSVVERSGVKTVWLAGFFYGHWPYSLERLKEAGKNIRAKGMAVQIANIPLGHPGDSLGSSENGFPLTPPSHWAPALSLDGKQFTGTSLHPPAVQENQDALKKLRSSGSHLFFLDDDFRLARGPGQIGGCFCPRHQEDFRRQHLNPDFGFTRGPAGIPDCNCSRQQERFLLPAGFRLSQWQELLQDIESRRLTSLVRSWIRYQCDELSHAFRRQEKIVGKGCLGIMVMYLGSEKAGIGLSDYTNSPFRVGELMFSDSTFEPPKGKTDELFSVLFHRRFARPELAYSETTAFPAGALSAPNMAAKLTVSTIADVRHTMFMSGLTPFPRTHWEILAPAMRKQARIHARLAGHQPHGPWKHFWGEASRCIGRDRPFSLWLAAGIPFEVTESLSREGWTFLSDEDALDLMEKKRQSPGTICIARPEAAGSSPLVRALPESLDALLALKSSLSSELFDIPYVLDSLPAICAWYPDIDTVLVWNLSYKGVTLTVRWREKRRTVTLDALDCALLEEVTRA